MSVQDGAYLVRDSTRQLANQPFTLMVLYQGKVFNIQIRQQHQQFLLGTGLKAQEVNNPNPVGVCSSGLWFLLQRPVCVRSLSGLWGKSSDITPSLLCSSSTPKTAPPTSRTSVFCQNRLRTTWPSPAGPDGAGPNGSN